MRNVDVPRDEKRHGRRHQFTAERDMKKGNRIIFNTIKCILRSI